MNLSWCVTPIMIDEKKNTDDLFNHVVNVARENGLVQNGDLVVITAGLPLGISGTTNLLKVQLVGNVLVCGRGVTSGTICGNICAASNEEEARKVFKPGDILVLTHTTNNILDLIKTASAIIVEDASVNSHTEIVGLALDKPVIVGAESATKLLKSGTTVTIDADRGIVFSGLDKSY